MAVSLGRSALTVTVARFTANLSTVKQPVSIAVPLIITCAVIGTTTSVTLSYKNVMGNLLLCGSLVSRLSARSLAFRCLVRCVSPITNSSYSIVRKRRKTLLS